MAIAEDEERFKRIFLDEALRKALYENGITPDNYQKFEKELRTFFENDAEYQAFVDSYLIQTTIISCREFLKYPQKMDLFLHPRYIQQTQHAHDFFEMKYQMAGSGTVHAGTDMLFLKEGDICLISPYVLHSSEIYSDDAVMINLVIPADKTYDLMPRIMNCDNPFRAYFLQDQNSGPQAVNSRYMVVETRRNPEIRTLFEEMAAYYSKTKGRSLLKELQMEADLERVFLLLLQQLPAANPEKDYEAAGTQENATAALSKYVRAHLKDVTLAGVAEFLHFSKPYTSRYIKKVTGYTFRMILLIFRMETAARLLTETDLTVDQIAEEVGLSGKTNFYKQFQGFYGTSPAKYRLSK